MLLHMYPGVVNNKTRIKHLSCYQIELRDGSHITLGGAFWKSEFQENVEVALIKERVRKQYAKRVGHL